MAIVLKSKAEIAKMRAANMVVCGVLDEIEGMVKPGISTMALEKRAREMVKEAGVRPAFLGYGEPPFPAVCCISLNEEVVHGIASEEVILKEGDIVSVDFGVEKDGFFGDSARTIAVGEVGPAARKLMDVTRESLERAIECCVPGNRLNNVSGAVQAHVEENGFSVVRAFVGHGIGKQMHEDPPVPNFLGHGRNPRLKAGMVLAIEPMVNEGSEKVRTLGDEWTVVTADGKLSAHFEQTVAITDDGPCILTQ